jgi:hypothetical protein
LRVHAFTVWLYVHIRHALRVVGVTFFTLGFVAFFTRVSTDWLHAALGALWVCSSVWCSCSVGSGRTSRSVGSPFFQRITTPDTFGPGGVAMTPSGPST